MHLIFEYWKPPVYLNFDHILNWHMSFCYLFLNIITKKDQYI